jgi:hypothetical protein
MTKIIHTIYLITLLVSAMFSLRVFRLNWPKAYKLFACFIFVAVFTELLATMWTSNTFGFQKFNPLGATNNHWIITIGLMPQYLLLMLVYLFLINSPYIKRIIAFIIPSYIVFSIINFIFLQGLNNINDYTHILASSIMLFLVFTHFEQIRKDTILLKLSNQPIVWISLGIFVYHLINIPYIFSMNYLISENFFGTALAFHGFYLFILIATYSLYIKAFLCPTPQQK